MDVFSFATIAPEGCFTLASLPVSFRVCHHESPAEPRGKDLASLQRVTWRVDEDSDSTSLFFEAPKMAMWSTATILGSGILENSGVVEVVVSNSDNTISVVRGVEEQADILMNKGVLSGPGGAKQKAHVVAKLRGGIEDVVSAILFSGVRNFARNQEGDEKVTCITRLKGNSIRDQANVLSHITDLVKDREDLAGLGGAAGSNVFLDNVILSNVKRTYEISTTYEARDIGGRRVLFPRVSDRFLSTLVEFKATPIPSLEASMRPGYVHDSTYKRVVYLSDSEVCEWHKVLSTYHGEYNTLVNANFTSAKTLVPVANSEAMYIAFQRSGLSETPALQGNDLVKFFKNLGDGDVITEREAGELLRLSNPAASPAPTTISPAVLTEVLGSLLGSESSGGFRGASPRWKEILTRVLAESPVHKGNLEKLGGFRRKSYQQRYFSLNKATSLLCWWSSRESMDAADAPKNSLNIGEYSRVVELPDNNSFQLLNGRSPTGKKLPDYQFRCPTAADCAQWLLLLTPRASWKDGGEKLVIFEDIDVKLSEYIGEVIKYHQNGSWSASEAP